MASNKLDMVLYNLRRIKTMKAYGPYVPIIREALDNTISDVEEIKTLLSQLCTPNCTEQRHVSSCPIGKLIVELDE